MKRYIKEMIKKEFVSKKYFENPFAKREKVIILKLINPLSYERLSQGGLIC